MNMFQLPLKIDNNTSRNTSSYTEAFFLCALLQQNNNSHVARVGMIICVMCVCVLLELRVMVGTLTRQVSRVHTSI